MWLQQTECHRIACQRCDWMSHESNSFKKIKGAQKPTLWLQSLTKSQTPSSRCIVTLTSSITVLHLCRLKMASRDFRLRCYDNFMHIRWNSIIMENDWNRTESSRVGTKGKTLLAFYQNGISTDGKHLHAFPRNGLNLLVDNPFASFWKIQLLLTNHYCPILFSCFPAKKLTRSLNLILLFR